MEVYSLMVKCGEQVQTKPPNSQQTKTLLVEGKKLPAGSYTLFVTPGEKEFTITFNSQLGQWGIKRSGEANEDPAKDVLVANC
jgi:hypothetical protein